MPSSRRRVSIPNYNSEPKPPRRTRPKERVADYSSPAYWSERFTTERDFEWLAAGRAVCPLVLRELERVAVARRDDEVDRASQEGPMASPSDGEGAEEGEREREVTESERGAEILRILHFGCGTSGLGAQVQAYLDEHFEPYGRRYQGRRAEVVDADYVADAIPLPSRPSPSPSPAPAPAASSPAPPGGVDTNSSDPEVSPPTLCTPEQKRAIPLLHLDVLSPVQLIRSMPPGGWDLLLDKSTADAISCGEDRPIPLWPRSRSCAETAAAGEGECEADHEVDAINSRLGAAKLDLDDSVRVAAATDLEPGAEMLVSATTESGSGDGGDDGYADDDEEDDGGEDGEGQGQWEDEPEPEPEPELEPIHALCSTLAHATRPGGRWVCISYSSSRFDHLSTASPSPSASSHPNPARAPSEDSVEATGQTQMGPRWRLLEKIPVLDGFSDAPRLGEPVDPSKGVSYGPEVNVWAYVLERV